MPFFPTLGNHDGSEREQRDDLVHYRDNFFLPIATLPDGSKSRHPERYYALRFGKDVLLLGLDTTENEQTLGGVEWKPVYESGVPSEQRRWLEAKLRSASDVPWKIAWFHHPPFHAGAWYYDVGGWRDELSRMLPPLLAQGGVRLAFTGHVHGFQLTAETEDGPRSRTRYVVSGAGGKGDSGPSRAESLDDEGIEAVNAGNEQHFLLVDVEGESA